MPLSESHFLNPRMWLLVSACLGLLSSQFSGLHMHVGTHGYVGVPEGTHLHGADTHAHEGQPSSAHSEQVGDTHRGQLISPNRDHAHQLPESARGGDHAGDSDVSVLDSGVGAAKLLIVLAWLGAGLPLTLQPSTKPRISSLTPTPKANRDRWRPPLRAPPFSPVT
jgi:hypothetical protein